MKYFELSNGVRLPAIGTGTNTFGRDDDNLMSKPTGNFTAMYDAIKSGYEFYDSAISYGNEEGIGACLQESGIARDKLFILSKIPNRPPFNVDRGSIRQSVKDSLSRMVSAGIISGSNGKLNPTGKVTRAEVAKMLWALENQ